MKGISVIILCLMVSVSWSHAISWPEIVAQVNQDIKQTAEDIKATQEMLNKERDRLNAELSSVKEEVARDEQTLQELKDQFETLLQEEEELRKETEAREEEIRTLEDTLRTVAKDVNETVRGSLLTPENSSRYERLAPLSDPDRFPGMNEIENLTEILFEEMEGSGEIRERTGTFITDDGSETEGRILRVGKFIAFYQLLPDSDLGSGGEVGYLRFEKKLQEMAAIPGEPPWHIRRAIEKYFAGETDHLPVDLTGGIIVEQVNQHHGISEWLEAGGVLVWPILVIGAVAVLLSIERLFSLGRIPTKTDKVMDRVRELVSAGDLKGCEELCGKKPRIPTCNVLKSGLQYAGAAREVIENALEEAVLTELPRLERFLPTLSVLAAIAPLLGLLGTVTGMIHTFRGITVFGTSDPRMMSGGISEALVTTQLGLGVAIPIMIVHHFFDRRAEKIIGDMEEKGTALVTLILNCRKEG